MLCCGARGCARAMTASRSAPVWSISLSISFCENAAGSSATRTPVHCKRGRDLQGQAVQRAGRVVAQQRPARPHSHRVLPGPQMDIEVIGEESDRLALRIGRGRGLRGGFRRRSCRYRMRCHRQNARKSPYRALCRGVGNNSGGRRCLLSPSAKSDSAAATAANRKNFMNPNPSAFLTRTGGAYCRVSALRRCRAAS